MDYLEAEPIFIYTYAPIKREDGWYLLPLDEEEDPMHEVNPVGPFNTQAEANRFVFNFHTV